MAARSIECEPRARPPRTVSTSQKLWLGFGTLTALLLLFGVTVVLQILSTEGQVHALATVTRERTAATQHWRPMSFITVWPYGHTRKA